MEAIRQLIAQTVIITVIELSAQLPTIIHTPHQLTPQTPLHILIVSLISSNNPLQHTHHHKQDKIGRASCRERV